MKKEDYLEKLYLVSQGIQKLRKEYKKKWPKIPPYDSSENEQWYIDFLRIIHQFPEIEFGFLRSGDENSWFMRRKPIWLDPSIDELRNNRLDEFEENEREELLFKFRREKGRLLFQSVRIAIPIYPDTTKKDIEQIWPRIEKLKKLAYGKIPKPKKDKWEENVEIYRFGQVKETIEEVPKGSGAPWSNLANDLRITAQACRERYESIKSFVNLFADKRTDKSYSKDEVEVLMKNLDCNICPKNKTCKIVHAGKRTGAKGELDCPYIEGVLGKGKMSSISYISVDKVEDKEAKDHGHWEPQKRFINKLFGDTDEQ